MEMGMQDSAEMCCCMSKLDKLTWKRGRQGRADLSRL